MQTEQEMEGTQENRQSMIDFGTSLIQSEKGRIYVLTIAGQIEGHQILPQTTKSTKYEHILPLLAMVEGSEQIDGLLVLLNNGGGDVEAGLAIAELIASMTKPTVSLVLGGSHSIGVPLAVSSRYSFIAPSAAMTIHPVRVTGMIVGAPQMFRYFERIQDRITEFVTNNSRIKRSDFTGLMMNTDELATDIGSVIDGRQAVNLGLINEIGGLSNALAKLYQMIREQDNEEKQE